MHIGYIWQSNFIERTMKDLTASGEFKMRNETVTLTFVTNSVSYYSNTRPVKSWMLFNPWDLSFSLLLSLSLSLSLLSLFQFAEEGKGKSKSKVKERGSEEEKEVLTALLMQSSVSVPLYVALYHGQAPFFRVHTGHEEKIKEGGVHFGHQQKAVLW